MAKNTITIRGYFPNIKSAILISGDGGAQLKLEVPELDMDGVVRLLSLRGEALKITFELDDG